MKATKKEKKKVGPLRECLRCEYKWYAKLNKKTGKPKKQRFCPLCKTSQFDKPRVMIRSNVALTVKDRPARKRPTLQELQSA